jgi:ubiquitin carboxyl-terminal hydrolase 14
LLTRKILILLHIVNIKWGKQTLQDIDVDVDQDVLTFKTQVYAMSNVPVDKQKIMIKGKILKVSNYTY